MHPSDSTSASPNDDAAIVRLIRERNAQGLRMLLAEHGATVRKGIERSLGMMLVANEVDEAMNAAAFNAWRAVDTFDPDKGSLRAWFFVIARNAGREILRFRKRQGMEPRSDEIEQMAATMVDESTTTGESVQPSQYLAALRECIDALPRVQKHIIKADLKSGDVADAGELAKALKTTRNSVYVSRSNARKSLRRELIARGFDAGDEQGRLSWQ